jgi:hypothetical protein
LGENPSSFGEDFSSIFISKGFKGSRIQELEKHFERSRQRRD